jgi:hypothetical protein
VSRIGPEAGAGLQRSPQSSSDGPSQQDLRDLSLAVRDLRRLTPSADVTQIQERQRLHFKLTQKFPNCIDVGLTVWERLTMWHLENHLPLKAARTPEGRMEMEFMFTTLVLKFDSPDTLIGNPYD